MHVIQFMYVNLAHSVPLPWLKTEYLTSQTLGSWSERGRAWVTSWASSRAPQPPCVLRQRMSRLVLGLVYNQLPVPGLEVACSVSGTVVKMPPE